jgi:ATP-dependent Clp protease ATP-binding subunit ClpB
MLRELQDSLAERGLKFTWETSVVDYLVKQSFSETYGARNLRRTIQKELEDPISEKIIDSFESPIVEIFAAAKDDTVQIESK